MPDADAMLTGREDRAHGTPKVLTTAMSPINRLATRDHVSVAIDSLHDRNIAIADGAYPLSVRRLGLGR